MGKRGVLCYDHLGNPYESKKAMALAWGIPYQTFITRINRDGWTIEKTLTTPVREAGFIDPTNGKWYETQEKMCEAHGMEFNTYHSRISGPRKMTPYEALTTPVKQLPKKWIGPDGRTYATMKDMCDEYKISTYNYMYRIKRGWDSNKALTTPINAKKSKGKKKACKDHTGKVFDSMASMLDHWNMPDGLFYDRMVAKWTLKEALEIPVSWRMSKEGPSRICKDHEGTEFNSLKDMCYRWGIPVTCYKERRYRGKISLEEALTTPLKLSEKAITKGGSLYAELNELSIKNKIPMGSIQQRIKLGWNILEAGTIPVMPYGTYSITLEGLGIGNKQFFRVARSGEPTRLMNLEKILEWAKTVDTRWKDAKGNYYNNFAELCKAYPQCTPHTVASRLRLGMPMELALDPRPIKKGPGGRYLLQKDA